jgi:hypothetical protein
MHLVRYFWVSLRHQIRHNLTILGWVLTLYVLGGCVQIAPPPSLIVPTTLPATNAISAAPTSPYRWTDETAVMSGICFEAALDAAGKVFVLRDAQAHIQFYDLADNSELCRRPVARNAFDFSSGRVLAGLWSYGTGCIARHDVLSIARDDATRTLLIRLNFVTEGDCNYELVRPFWIGLDGVRDYQIEIQVAGT